MSEYRVIELEVTSTTLLREAIQEVCTWMGIGFAEHEQAQSLVGYHGERRNEKAKFIIDRRHITSASNDLGWVRDPESGKYRLIISEYDQRQTKARQIALEVKKAYVLKEGAQRATALGYTATPVKDVAGKTVEIKLRRY